MKKVFCILLSTVLLLCFASCSGGDSSNITTQAGATNSDSQAGATSTTTASAATTPQSGGSMLGDSVDIDIKESNYVSYINEIYTNTADYVGDVVRIQGMFSSESVAQTGKNYYYVYRVGPGCCGNDGSMCGLEFTWSGVNTLKDNDWIEVIGTLGTYKEGNKTYLTLSAQSVTVMTTRGAEKVTV